MPSVARPENDGDYGWSATAIVSGQALGFENCSERCFIPVGIAAAFYEFGTYDKGV
jgi:hypothetical protein